MKPGVLQAGNPSEFGVRAEARGALNPFFTLRQMPTLDPDKLDFDHCHEEPIHRPEQIQGYGYLIAVDPDSYAIRIHSENLKALFKSEQGDGYLNQNFLSALEPEDGQVDFVRLTCERARASGTRLPVELHFKTSVVVDPSVSRFHAVVYESASTIVFEVEPAKNFIKFQQARQLANVYAMAVGPLFERMTEVDEVASAAADLFRSLTGYERVVVCRFHEDGTGLVISESKSDEVESYLGLQYPASDIPSQARALYLQNWIRINPDVDLPTVALLPSVEESGRPPLDLTKSVVRAMSPIHAQYVRNQGLRSSMSISLINRGRLWGLISCHHRESHYIEQAVRIECERMGHLIGWQLHAKEEETAARERAATDRVIDTLLEDLGTGCPVIELFQRHTQSVLAVMDAVGFALCSSDRIERVGVTPNDEAIATLLRTADADGRDEYVTHRLGHDLGDEVDFGSICGALVIPMLPKERMYTIWFRSEHVRTIRWAGDPAETSPSAEKRLRLMPRESFTVHEQVVRGESKAFRGHTIDTATRFNKLFLRHALQARLELQADFDRLEQREQVKNDFIATLAHELRNPLSPIAHGVELLEAQPNMDREERAQSFNVIKRQLTHLVTLVDDLLDLSRITNGKIRVEHKVVEIADVLESALEGSRHLRDRKRQKLRLDVPKEAIRLEADFTRLTQAFGNVISNAVKYTPTGGTVEVVARRDQGSVAVDISDDGVGLTPVDIDRIFEMFSQVSPYSPQAGGGLGIGLSLTRSLLELHGGTISAYSDGPDRGSRFRITLPALDEVSASPTPSKAPVAENAIERPRRVMIVDDNPDVADMLAMVAKRRGHQVLVAYSPYEALDTFEAYNPEVVLLDIGLPGMDGVELRRELAKRCSDDAVVFVAQTGWGQEADRERTRDAGFHYHLVKPVQTGDLARVFLELDRSS